MPDQPILKITGELATPRQLRFADLEALPPEEQILDVSRIDPKRQGDAVTLDGSVAFGWHQTDREVLGTPRGDRQLSCEHSVGAGSRAGVSDLSTARTAAARSRMVGRFGFISRTSPPATRTKSMSVPTSNSSTTSN